MKYVANNYVLAGAIESASYCIALDMLFFKLSAIFNYSYVQFCNDSSSSPLFVNFSENKFDLCLVVCSNFTGSNVSTF